MSSTADILRTTIRIAADHPSLAGHFPGRPIVPGVVLLDHVLQAIQQHQRCALRAMPVVKFLQPVLPDDSVDVEISVSRSDGGELRASFRGTRASTLVLEGSFVLSDAAGDGS